MDPIDLSSKLISFKSISPKSDGSIEFIQKILQAKKFKCNSLEFGRPKVKNLYAEYTGGKGPTVCFAGHTDVVPPGDIKEWESNPFKSTIKNGNLYGRGASDMKTGIASFLSATIFFLEKKQGRFNGCLSFLITSDEEGNANYGTKSVVEWLEKKKKKIDFCLVGEPTNPSLLGEMVKIGRRGSLNGVIDIKGKQGHVAYPEKATNPIDCLLKICDVIQQPLDEGSKIFQPSKLVITSIDVNNKVTNIIPGNAKIRFNVRFNNNFTSKKIIEILEQRIAKVDNNIKISFKVSGESFFNFSEKLTDAISKSIKKITKKTPILSTSGGTSDARFIAKLCPVIEFGIVGKTMHQTNENVSIKDIASLSKIYFEFLENIFSEKFY